MAALVACASAGSRRSERGGEASEAAGGAIPRMEASGPFFDGQIEAEVLLARVGAHWKRPDESGQAANRREGGARGGFSGSVGGFGGGRHGGHRGGRGGEPEGGGAGGAELAATPIHASNLPAAALRLRLTNHGAAPVAVEVIDFNSSLGDFVVEPSTIALPPDTPTEAEPMISRLGVGTEEIPLTVRLRLGARSEQRVLTLRAVKAPAPPAPPAAPAPPPS